MHEDGVLVPAPESLDPTPLRGRDAVREYMLPNLFERQTVEAVEFIEEGDSIFVHSQVWARARTSGAELDLAIFQVWRFRGDLAERAETHLDREPALAALRGS